MHPVRDQSGRANPTTSADPIEGNGFVSGEPDNTGGEHPPEVGQGRGVGEAADGFHTSHDRGQGDHRDDEQARQVLGSSEPVGVAPGGGATAECERDPQRHSSQRIREIVDRVGEQSHGPADRDDPQLRHGRGAQDDETDLDRADALSAGFQRVVDRVGGIVAVWDEDLVQPTPESGGVVVGFRVVVRWVPMNGDLTVTVVSLGGHAGSWGWWWRG